MNEIFKGRPNIVTPVMEERIILVAYQDGSWFDKLIVHHVRKENPKVEKLYQAHLQAVRDVRIVANEVVCPDSITDRLLDIAGTERQRMPWYADLKRGYHALQATTALAATFVIAFMLVTQFRGPSAEQREVEEAMIQAKASFALISEIMNGSTKTLHDEVIMNQTVKPLRDSIFKGTETIRNNL